jgi:hypothetical protein
VKRFDLKNIIVDETFIYYDGPKFYSFHTHVGQKFLALCVNENTNRDEWLYIEISDNRYEEMLQNQKSLYEIFKHTENGLAYMVTHKKSGEVISEEILSEKIDDSNLPAKGYFFNNIGLQSNESIEDYSNQVVHKDL